MNTPRIPPQSKEAEAVTLGAMMLEVTAIADVRSVVSPEDFYTPAHQTICRAIFQMFDTHKPVDLVTLPEHLGKLLESVGGVEYLQALAEGTPRTESGKYYAGIVRDKAKARKAIALCLAYQQRLFDDPEQIGDLLETFQVDVYRLGQVSADAGTSMSLGDAVHAAMQRAEDVSKHGVPPALMTGFERIDKATGGFDRGDLITLSADTAAGKTSLALDIVANVAGQGGPVLVVSGEMMPREIGKRFLQARSKVRGQQIKFAQYLSEQDWTELHRAAGEMDPWKVYVEGRCCTVAEIAARARQLSARWEKPLSLIVVDYVQLMNATEGDNRAQKVGGYAWGLKRLAMDLGVPVLMLSQLNRAGAKSKEAPGLHDLKESGDLENHSNAVLFLYEPKDTQVDGEGRVAMWFRVAKARDGIVTPWDGAGSIRLWWHPSITHFEPAN